MHALVPVRIVAAAGGVTDLAEALVAPYFSAEGGNEAVERSVMILIELIFAMVAAALVLVLLPLLLVMAGIVGVMLLWVTAPAVLIAALVLWLVFPTVHGALVFVLLAVVAMLLLERRSRYRPYRY